MNINDVYAAFFEGSGFNAGTLAGIVLIAIASVLVVWGILAMHHQLAESKEEGMSYFTQLYKCIALIIASLTLLYGFIHIIYIQGFPFNL